jgi:hypothetical protein
MKENELINLIDQKYRESQSASEFIQDEREEALKFYKQDLFGNEVDGKSKVVTSDVRDTIEWILPQLVELFIGDGNPVVFKPRNAEDIEQAKQESQYVQFVYNEQNNGYLNTYTWFKDSLLQKNGYIKAYWQDSEDTTNEEYQNQNFAELSLLLNDEELELKELEVYLGEEKLKKYKKLEKFNESVINREIDILNPNLTFNAAFQRVSNTSKVNIQCVAPEFMSIDAGYDSVDLKDCPFVREDCYNVTESDLIAEGYDEEIVKNLPSTNDYEDREAQERFETQGGLFNHLNTDQGSQRKIKVSDIYLRADFDGDGISELRFVKLAADREILENYEVDAIPYFSITPIIMPHAHYGLSIYDIIKDIQTVRSTLIRQSLDSLYLANDPRYQIVRGEVDIADLIDSQSGGVIRSNSIDSLRVLQTPFTGSQSFPMFELLDKMRSERTGVSEASQGLDPNALSDSTNLVGTLIMNAAQSRIKLIARTFAEVGMKPLMAHIHSLILKNEENEKIFDLNNEFIVVDPTKWKTRSDLVVKVGIGYSDKKEKVMALERILNLQQQVFAAQGGVGALLGLENVYNAIQDLQELSGLDYKDRYFSNPANYQPPPPQETAQDRTLDIAQAQVVADTNEKAARMDFEKQKYVSDVELKKQEIALQIEKLNIEKMKIKSAEKQNTQDNLTDLTEARIKTTGN